MVNNAARVKKNFHQSTPPVHVDGTAHLMQNAFTTG